MAGHLQAKGALVLDAGAVKVLRSSGKSLLPIGVKSVEGRFQRGEMVVCFDQSGNEVARGLINYPVAEARLILGKSSQQIESILGYVADESLIHRDNLVLSD